MKKLSLGKCSVAIQFVAKHIDEVAARNDKKEVAHLKKLLRLDGVTEMVDVAEAGMLRTFRKTSNSHLTSCIFCEIMGRHAT